MKERYPDVQLALVGSMAHDDPEGWDYYNQTVAYADGDPDIYILSNLNNVGSVEVNAFQVHSTRGAPEVDQGGLRPDGHARRSGRGGRRSPGAWAGSSRRSSTARRAGSSSRPRRAPRPCLEILDDPARRAARGAAGKEYVRTHFLTPRLLRDWLALFNR